MADDRGTPMENDESIKEYHTWKQSNGVKQH